MAAWSDGFPQQQGDIARISVKSAKKKMIFGSMYLAHHYKEYMVSCAWKTALRFLQMLAIYLLIRSYWYNKT